jgi:hypothetical protein
MRAWSDDAIAAFADRELPRAEAERLEAETGADSALAARIAEARALRDAVAAAYAGALDEAPPERLLATIRRPADVVDLAEARTRLRSTAWRAAAPRWAALAASLGVAFIAGRFAEPRTGPIAIGSDGSMTAAGRLEQSLTHALASSPQPGAPVAIGVTFVDQDGRYCRTFLVRRASPVAGLACRYAGGWRVSVAAAARAETGAYRTAADQVPPAVMDVVDQSIRGEPLDAAHERSARDGGWTAVR